MSYSDINLILAFIYCQANNTYMFGLMNTKYFRIFTILVIISLVSVLIVLDYLRDWTAENPETVEKAIVFVDEKGVLGMFLFALGAGTLIPFPVEPVLGGVVVLGSQQVVFLILAAALGHTLGTSISFYLARYLREPFVYKRIDKHSIKAFHKFWKKYGRWTLFVTVLIPIFPGDILAFVAGLSEMKYKRFVIIILTAKLITYTFFALLSFKVASIWFSGVI